MARGRKPKKVADGKQVMVTVRMNGAIFNRIIDSCESRNESINGFFLGLVGASLGDGEKVQPNEPEEGDKRNPE